MDNSKEYRIYEDGSILYGYYSIEWVENDSSDTQIIIFRMKNLVTDLFTLNKISAGMLVMFASKSLLQIKRDFITRESHILIPCQSDSQF